MASDADKAVTIAEIEMQYRVELFNKCVAGPIGALNSFRGTA